MFLRPCPTPPRAPTPPSPPERPIAPDRRARPDTARTSLRPSPPPKSPTSSSYPVTAAVPTALSHSSRAKWAVEERIRSLGIPHTILAPTYLMENLFNPWNVPALRAGVLPSPISVDRPLQQTAVADLLSLAALALERPDEFARRRIAVGSDEL